MGIDIDKYKSQPDKVCYELWGWDTFSSESYFVGLYDSLSSAEQVRQEQEEEAKKTQDEQLRDTFSIVRTTVGEHIEMVRQREDNVFQTRELVRKHKKIIDDVWTDFRKLAQEHGGESGEHSLSLIRSHPDCELSKLTIEDHPLYEQKCDASDVFYITAVR